jgi:hypothetical protein
MMTGRAGHEERGVSLSSAKSVDGVDASACGAERCVIRMGSGDGVLVERAPAPIGGGDGRDMRGRMHRQQLAHGRWPRREDQECFVDSGLTDTFEDRARSFRALWVAWTRDVPLEHFVESKEQCHGSTVPVQATMRAHQ